VKKAIALLIVIGLAVTGIWYAGRQPPSEVSLHKVSRGLVEKTVSNTRAGTVEACRRSRLSMPIGGRVDALHVDEGDRVEASQVLLSLWNKGRKAMTAQAGAQLLAARHHAERSCVEAENAEREAERMETLHEKQLASREATELARTRAKAGSFGCQASRDEEQVAQANLQMNQAMLEETYLRAPFAGIIAEINGEIGEYVTPSPPGVATPPAVDLIDYSCLYVTAPIDEVYAGQLSVGLPARLSLDAFRGEHFRGRLDRIAPYVLDLERQAPCVLADEHLGQLHFYHAGVTKQRHISDLSPDIPIDGSLLAGNGVNCVSALVPVAVNDELLLLFIEFYLIDPLPLEAQNIPLDADVHIPVLYKVVRSLIYQQIMWGSASFFHS
jgi:HlyD family secretion protein